MATLKIYVVPKGKTFSVTFDPAVDTEETIIRKLRDGNMIGEPPQRTDGGVTIWKMKKGIRSGSSLGDCIDGTGFDGAKVEVAYLTLDPDPIPEPE